MIETLQKYAMIIGVVMTIGGGFYAWGVFNNRLDAVSAAVGSDTVEKLQKEVAVLDKKLEVMEAKLEELKAQIGNPLGR
jgi:prefoldin subunit 5|tara:strand:+ start:1386 stop:1622 length:237 start_codon:yes stop_codon:yes gene_type:complete